MKKILSCLLALSLLASMFTGAAVAEGTLFIPGTYEGVGNGYGGELKVAVEVSGDAILSVTILENKETAGVADPALNKIPAAIVEHQTLAVDTISGCTIASNAVLTAATQALSQACSDMDALYTQIEEKAVSTEMISLSADVVVIGGGGAGLSAATEAAEAGSSVILLEKMGAIGGNTIRAGSALNAADPARQQSLEMLDTERATIEGLLAMDAHDEWVSKWQNELKAEYAAHTEAGHAWLFDSPTLHKLQTYKGGDYVANPALVDIFAENALAATEFLTKYGTQWQGKITAAMGATWKRSHTPELVYGNKGTSFTRPLETFLKENGHTILVDYKAEHLIMENGRCVGVTGKTTEGQPFTVRAAKGVVIATGGFSANVEMRQAYNKHWAYLGENLSTSNHPGATGDGIIMAQEVEANLVGMEWIQLTPWGNYAVPQAAIDNQIFVNKEGKRFINEDNRRDVMASEALKQTDAQFFLIYDGNIITDGLSQTGNDVDAKIGVEYDTGERVYKADTLEDLCAQIGVPYEALKATIDEFNACVDGAEDPLGRALFDKKIGKAPFYASLTSPGVHHTMGGIEINEKAQVLNVNGSVIPGLFAAGETTGGVHGSNRLGGNAITDIFVFGRIAGQGAAAE